MRTVSRITVAVLCLIVLLAICVPSVRAAAPEISVQITPDEGTVSETYQLRITMSGEENFGTPYLEKSESFRARFSGQGTNITNVNGEVTRQYTVTFDVVASTKLAPGKYALPDIHVPVDGVERIVSGPEIKITAGQAVQGFKKYGIDLVQLVDNLAPYEGQQIVYRCEIVSTADIDKATLENLDFQGFLHMQLNKGNETVRRIANGNARVHTVKDALFPTRSGELEIPARKLVASIRDASKLPTSANWDSFFDDVWGGSMFDQMNYVQREFVAEGISLQVKPLPKPPSGVTGYIPVGNLKHKVGLEKDELKQGESTTLKIVVVGDANLRPLELKLEERLSSLEQARIYSDAPQLDTKEDQGRIIMEKAFSAAIIPQSVGELTVPPIRIPYFDPSSESYKELATPELKLRVAKNPDFVAPPPATSTILPDKKKQRNSQIETPQESEDPEPGLYSSTGVSPLWGSVVVGSALLLVIARLIQLTLRRRPAEAIAVPVDSMHDVIRSAKARISEKSAAEIWQEFRQSVGQSVGIDTNSFTSGELVELIKMHAGTVSEETLIHVRRLEKLSYGGSTVEEIKETLEGLSRLPKLDVGK